MARTSVVLPAPRPPESATKSPGAKRFARSTARRRVASSFASAIVKLAAPGGFDCIDVWAVIHLFGGAERSGGRDRKNAYHRSTLSRNRLDAHLAAMQLDEGAHDRQPETGAAMAGSLGVGFEPVEYLIFDLAGNTGTVVADREDHGFGSAQCREHHGFPGRREPDGIGEQVEQDLPDAALVGDEAADVRGGL